MPKRQKVIHIEDKDDRRFYAWTELSPEQIAGIEGVETALNLGHKKYSIIVDPRYDFAEVQRELAVLAIEMAAEEVTE